MKETFKAYSFKKSMLTALVACKIRLLILCKLTDLKSALWGIMVVAAVSPGCIKKRVL